MSKHRTDDSARVHATLKAETFNLGQFAGSDASTQALVMLDALIAAYSLDLIRVPPEGLIRLQSALQQAQALRAVFAGEALDIPKI